MAKLLDGTRIYGSANIDNSLIVNTMNIVPTITSSFLQANNANIYAFGAHQTANSAQIHANAAFLQANQVGGAVSTVNGALTAANTNMVFKTGNTMTGNLVMSGANIAFSTNSNAGIYWGGSGLSFIHSPNSNVIVFGTGNSEDMRLDPSGILTVYSGITVAGTNIAPTLAFAYTHANGAFNQSNNANIYAFGAHRTANSAQVHANAAFLQANNANIYAFGAHQTANSAQVHANAAFLQANNANIYAFGAHQTANSAQVHANAAFVKANAAFPSTGGSIIGDVTISGNLIVIGNSTIFNVSSLVINDPLIFLGNNNYTSDLVDIGFVGHYNDGVNAHTGFIRDSSNKEYFVFNGYTPEVLANDNINIAHPSFALANVNANYYKGNLISNTVVITISATIAGVNIVPTLSSSFIHANAAFDQANVAYTHANGAFLQANNANIYAFGAHQTANSAQIHANAAFLQANNANIYAFGAHQTANSAHVHANAAFLQANQVGGAVSTVNGALTAANTNMVFKTGNTMTGNLVMSGANIAFVTNSNSGVYWGGSGLSFIHSPNSNVIVFGTSNVEDMRLDPSGILTVYNGITVAGTNIAPTLAFAYTHANGAFNQANNANIYAFGAHRTANSAHVHANAAFLQANNANIYAFGAHQTANSAHVHANAAFLQANQVGGAVSTANGALAAANTNMVFKTGNTMTGNLVMSGANIAFSTNSNAGIYWGGSGLSFIHSPNSNVIVFGTSNDEDMRLDSSGILTVYSGITVAGTNIAPTLAFAYTHANGAFNQANNANIYSFGAHRTANSAQVHANAAFLQANQVGGAVSTANGALAAANTNMVFKTGNTMTGNLVMSGANIAFVTNSNVGIYWGGSGLSFIHSPNSNVIVFGTGNNEDMRLDPNGILTVYNGITVAGTNIAPTLAFAYTHANGAFDQANTARVHANAAFTKANLAAPIASPTFTGTVTSPSPLILLKVSDPSEGGEIVFEKTSSSNLSGNLTLDLFGNLVRIFEQTGSNRGFFLDITKGNTGVAGEILHTNNWFNFISTSGGGTSSNSVVYYSDSPPTGVANGTLWWQSNTGGLFIRYGDGDSTQWVATQQQGVGGSATFAQPANNSIVQNTTQLLATANGLSYTSSTFASAGDASINKYMLIGTTTNATPTRLLHSGGSGLIPVRSNTTIQYTVDIVARRTDVVGEGAGWTLKGVLDNFSGTVADVGNLYEIIVARDDTNYAVDALANNTSKSLDVMVTGVAAKQIRWVAYVQTIEVSQ